jgi:hypothetical protein
VEVGIGVDVVGAILDILSTVVGVGRNLGDGRKSRGREEEREAFIMLANLSRFYF